MFYIVTKYSYKGSGPNNCFLPGMYCGSCNTLDSLLDLVEKYITMTNTKSVWEPEDPKDGMMFYTTTNYEFEDEIYHGYKIQVVGPTSKNESLSVTSDKEAWQAVRNMVREYAKKYPKEK